MVSAPARRELVRQMVDQGLSERRALTVAGMSASAYRYATRPDRNEELQTTVLLKTGGTSQPEGFGQEERSLRTRELSRWMKQLGVFLRYE